MAKETNNDTEEDSVPQGKNKLIVIAIILLSLLLVGGGGAFAYFALHGKTDSKSAKEAVAVQPEAPPVYTKLEPITVNLHEEDTAMQTTLTLQDASPDVDAKINLRMPEIRNQAILILSSKKSADVKTEAGKEALSKQLAKAFNETIEAKNSDDGVRKVLFTEFIIQ